MLIEITDYAGALFSFISTIMYTRNSVWAWPFCILTNIVNFYLFMVTGIYADALLEFFYISLAIYGIWHWLYGGKNHQELQISNLPVTEALILLFFLVSGFEIVQYFLSNHTDSNVARLDALAMSLSLVAQWLMCRRYVETWVMWFITDFVLATLFYYKNLPAHLYLNLIYLPITAYGYYKWHTIRLSLKPETVDT